MITNCINSLNIFTDVFFLILGGFLAVIITDFIKRPKLKIQSSPGSHQGGKIEHAIINGTITNKPFNFLGIKIEREAAIDCHASIETVVMHPQESIEGVKLPDEKSKRTAHRLLWEVDLSSKLEPKKTIYSGCKEKLRIFGKINQEPDYFAYNQEDVFQIMEGAKYLDSERKFILTIKDIKGNKVSKEIDIINAGINLNDIKIK